ncbi:hypothetical protein BSKO_12207 [Bryopsis sp. KO-2023]|nr:hypothetical protein BSKO_12207 [Bryopsis sp. KO-2023]
MDNSNPTMRMLMKTWESKISIRISLAANDVSCPNLPLPMMVMLPRYGFLQTVADKAFQSFERALISKHDYTPYFEYNGLPLPWQVPLGSLYDLLADDQSPWRLIIRFPSAMPPALLPWIRSDSEKNFDLGPLRSVLFSSLKEAAFICRGVDGSNDMNMMEVGKRDSLWESVVKVDWAGYNNWIESMDMNPLNRRAQEALPRIPIRIFHRKGKSVSDWSADVKSMSRPISVQEDGRSPTLGEALNDIFPELVFEEEQNDGGGLLGDELMRSTELSEDGDCEPSSKDQVFSQSVAIVCGIQPPLATPLAWLHYNMHAPDFFLYIIVKPRNPFHRVESGSVGSGGGC